jgi:cytochrome c5
MKGRPRMTTVFAWLLLSALVLELTGSRVAAAGTAPAAAPAPAELRAGPGAELTGALCSLCHSLDYIESNVPAMDGGGWKKTVQKMRERFGAPVTDEQAKIIVEYLGANYSGKS